MKSSSMKQKRAVIDNGKHILIVSYGLSYLQGNSDAYFTVTGQIWRYNPKTGTKTGRDCESCGCLHDDILHAFPDMADIISLHLSDESGIPVHCIENGWYWNGGSQYQEYNREVLANYLRITPGQADALHEQCKDKNTFTEKVVAMFPRFVEEAQATIKKYSLREEL